MCKKYKKPIMHIIRLKFFKGCAGLSQVPERDFRPLQKIGVTAGKLEWNSIIESEVK